jgi:phosphopantetheine--protein transferase-like protein
VSVPVDKMRPSGLVGLGIDLVSNVRIRKFLREHCRKAIYHLLTTSEQEEFRRKRFPPIFFSKLFAAKEAFFKSRGMSWMGMDGFSKVEIECLPRGRFRAKTISPKESPMETGEGCFFGNGRYTGAQVMIWQRPRTIDRRRQVSGTRPKSESESSK